MPRISPDSAVRRRLFPSDTTDEAKTENIANVLLESVIRDRLEKSKKWNFDFENEVPLNGTYDWYPCNGTAQWVGVTRTDDESSEQDSFLPMKLENEVTPKVKETKSLFVGNSLKRRINFVVDKNIRRRITFE